MLNLSDNELDKLSREAAEKFEPAENAQSWNKLEQLLDKNLGKPSPVPKITKPGIPFIYSGAILIAISAIYFLTKSKKDINNSTLQNSATINQQQSNKNSQRDSNSVVLLNNLNKKQETRDKKQAEKNDLVNNEITNKEQEKQADKNEITSKGINDKKQENPNDNKENNQTEKNNLVGETKGTRQKNNLINNETRNKEQAYKNEIADTRKGNKKENNPAEKNNDSKIVVGKSANKNPGKNNLLSSNNMTQQDYASAGNQRHHHNIINDKKDKNNIDLSNENELNLLQQNQQEENLKFASIPGIALLPTAFEGINDSALRKFNPKTQLSNTINIKKSNNRMAFVNRSLQIGFLFAPEFSKVKYIYNNNRIGNSLGITLGYQLFSKLSVNSGVIFSKKYYQADEKQFHGPQNAAGSNFDIEFVNASANVIDIPLNLRYNYFSDGNSTFFINGGFSSYIMKKENFDYYCHYYNGGFQYQGWIRPQQPSSLQKNYLFSILNLSAGFETSINNSFSFQFEPYMKLPLKGIGFGKVDLSSYGINMSVKYSPVLKRGRR